MNIARSVKPWCVAVLLAFQVASAGAADRRDTVLLNWESNPAGHSLNFNPFTRNNLREAGAHQAMWEPLFLLDYATGTLEPWLGLTIVPDATQRVWTLTLRPNVTWSDETPFTAADVVFTVQMVRDHPKLPAVEASMLRSQVANVAATGPLQVVFTLRNPNPRFALETFGGGMFGSFLIMPKHVWAGQIPEEFTFPNPIGTGPYTFVSATASQVTWKRDDDWWGAEPVPGTEPEAGAEPEEGAEPVEPTPVFRPLPEPLELQWLAVGSTGASLSMLIAGTLDAAGPFSLDQFEAAVTPDSPIIGWNGTAGPAWNDPCGRQLDINLMHPGDDGTLSPWSSSAKLRKALSLLIDRTQLANEGYPIWAIPPTAEPQSDTTPSTEAPQSETSSDAETLHSATTPSVTMFPSYGGLLPIIQAIVDEGYGLGAVADPVGADSLLQAEGYTRTDGGFYAKDGEVLTANIAVNSGVAADVAAVNALVKQLRAAGVDASIVQLTNEEYWGRVVPAGYYEMVYGWLSCGSIAEPFTSMNRYAVKFTEIGNRAPGFNNTGRWNGPAADAYAKLVGEVANLPLGVPPGSATPSPQMVAKVVEAYSYLDAEMPFIPLVQSPSVMAFNTSNWVGWPEKAACEPRPATFPAPACTPMLKTISMHRILHQLHRPDDTTGPSAP